MTRNKFKVPKRTWARWTEVGRQVFNILFESMIANQSVYIHPKSSIRPQDHWRTTCWNAAWTVADAASATTRQQVVQIKLTIADIKKDIDQMVKNLKKNRKG